MGYRSSLNCIRELYCSWNERRWSDYAERLAPDLLSYPTGFGPHLNKSEHIALKRRFCDICPDSHVHAAPHLILFANADGTRACVVSRLTGTLPDAIGGPLAFDVTVAGIYRLRKSRIVEYRRFIGWPPTLPKLDATSPLGPFLGTAPE